jgi:hypothetical protein
VTQNQHQVASAAQKLPAAQQPSSRCKTRFAPGVINVMR